MSKAEQARALIRDRKLSATQIQRAVGYKCIGSIYAICRVAGIPIPPSLRQRNAGTCKIIQRFDKRHGKPIPGAYIGVEALRAAGLDACDRLAFEVRGGEIILRKMDQGSV